VKLSYAKQALNLWSQDLAFLLESLASATIFGKSFAMHPKQQQPLQGREGGQLKGSEEQLRTRKERRESYNNAIAALGRKR